MARDVQSLLVQIEASTASLRSEMKRADAAVGASTRKIDTQLSKIDKAFDGLGLSANRLGRSVAGAFAGIAAGLSVKAIIDATTKQENAIRQLEARIKSTGGVAGYTSLELQEFASSLQKVTTFGDEAVIEMQSLLLTFTNIRGDTVKGATEAILNVSTALGSDLKSASLQVGKALNDPIKGVSALAEAGIQFTQKQKDTIKALVDTGRTAEAQGVILGELETQFGGAARAAADTFGGAMKQAQNAFGDLLEAPGGLNDGKAALQDLTRFLQDPATVNAAAALTSGLIKGFTEVASVIRETVGLTQYLAEELAATFNGVAADDIVRLNDQLDRLQKMKDGGVLDRLVFFGRDGVASYKTDEEIDAEIAKIQAAIDAYAEIGNTAVAAAPKVAALSAATGVVATAATTSSKAVNDHVKALDALIAKYDPAAKAQAEYEKGIELADEALRDGTYTTEQYQKVVQGLYTDLNKPIWDKHNKQAKEAADAIKKIDDQLESVRDRLDPVRAATKRLTAEKKLLKEALDKNRLSFEEYQLRLQQLEKEYDDNTRATSDWAKWTEGALDRVDGAFADAWRNIGDGFSSFRDSLTNAFKQMLAELAHMAITRPIVLQIGAALGIGGAAGQATAMMGGGSGGGIGVGSLLQYGQTAYSAITGVGPAALAGWQSGGLMGGIQGVGGYYGGALSGINAGAGQVIGTLLNGGGMTYAPLSYQLSSGALNGAIGGLSGIGGALYGYGQAGLKGAATGGLGAWGGATLGNILLPGIGGIIGGALGSALGGSLFGGKWQTKDVGLAFSVENGDFLGQQYEYQKKKRGRFRSNKKRTRFSALDDETAARFQSVFDATEDTVAGLFESLSYSVEEASLAGLQLARTKISTKGKTEEQIQEAIADWFGSAADAMTAELNKVFATGLDLDFEGMQAFVGNLQGVNEVLRYLDVGMYDASVAGGKLAEALSQAAGGLESLAASSATYYAAFFSEAEKVEDTIDSITRAFESADVTLASSREAYRAMVEDIDLTTEAGQKMFATLMALSGQAAQYYDILEQQAALYYDKFTTGAQKADDVLAAVTAQFSALEVALPATRDGFIAAVDALDRSTEAGQKMFATMMALSGQAAQYYDILEQQAAQANALLIGSVNTAYAALQRSIAAQQRELQAAYSARIGSLNDMAATASANLSGMTSVASSLDAALKRLRGTSDDAVRMLRAQAVMTLNSALVTARAGGSLAGFEGLQDALDVASEMDASLYGSLEDFEREQGRTANLVAELEKVNGKQLTTEEKLLRSVQDQLKTAQQQYEADMAGLDAQLAYAQAQLDALNGIDNSIMGVAAAIAAMNASVVAALQGLPKGAAQANTPQNNRSIIDTIYQSVLGRGTEGDEAGAAFWANALQNGTATYQDIATSIAKGALANAGESSAGKKSAEQYLKSLGIPGFASGGLFGGGLRIVGEKGPELEVTGPSRIYNASQTAAMLGGGSDTAQAIASLQQSVERQGDALRSIAKHTMQTARRVEFLERWDFDGLPKERGAA